MKTTRIFFVFLFAALLCPSASGQAVVAEPQTAQLSVAAEKADGVYQVGQPITWHIEASGFDPDSEASYTIKRGGLTEVDHSSLQLVDDTATVTTSLDKPGALLLEVTLESPDGEKHTALGGAIVAPDEIKPSAERPADFDAFWAGKLAELAKVPPHAKLTPEDSGQPGVEYWKITLDNIRGTHIQGQLARPTKATNCPRC